MPTSGPFERFFSTFEINNADNFNVDLYVDGSVDFAPNLLNWMKKIRNKERYKYLRFDVTIGHLEKVNETGISFDVQ